MNLSPSWACRMPLCPKTENRGFWPEFRHVGLCCGGETDAAEKLFGSSGRAARQDVLVAADVDSSSEDDNDQATW